MEPNRQAPQQEEPQAGADACASTPVTATNAQPGAVQRQGVPESPKATEPDQQAGGPTCGEGGCL